MFPMAVREQRPRQWEGEELTTAQEIGSDVSHESEMERLGKESANPLGSLWMLWNQNDATRYGGDFVKGKEWVNSYKFQPVMSIPLKFKQDTWNLIIRPVFQYQSVPLKKDVGKLFGLSPSAIASDPKLSKLAADPIGRTTGVGDLVLLTLLGPAREDGFIWGVGASQIFPTAEEDVLDQGKWQAGPAFLVARMAPKPGGFNLGILGQHWWSYAGKSKRKSTSLSNFQYFINYRLSNTELIGMSPNITVNWEADSGNKLTLPIGLGYSNIYKIGPLPVRVALEAQYSVVSPDNVGSDWSFRVMIIPIVPSPFANMAK